jgi:uncharacterized iron-regulated membrane protein
MRFRPVLFWLHLIAGVIAGLVIAVMCFTGAALAFEKQLVAWSERDARLVPPPGPTEARQSLDELSRAVREEYPDARPASIIVSADPHAAVAFSLGRDQTVYANPYTGEVRTPASTRVHDVLHMMEEWHRWLALSGDHRPVGKLVNGTANAAFFVLAVTGLYLWLPRTWSWRGVKAVAVFNWRLAGKARDFNWHNSIGLWSAPILIVLTLTALPMSFRWANALLYRAVGDEAPAQQGPGGAPAVELPAPPAGARPLDRDALFAAVQKEFPNAQQITLRLGGFGPRGGGSGNARSASAATRDAAAPRGNSAPERRGPQPLTFVVNTPRAWPRTATTTVVLHPFTGEILRRDTFAAQTAGRRLRTWTRFLHTGEALGWLGQLIAGLACVGGCALVYTGFALAFRRFFRRGARA